MYLNLQAPRYSRVCENQVPLYREYLSLYKDYLVRYDAFRVSNQIVAHNSNKLGIYSGKHNEGNSDNRNSGPELEIGGIGIVGSECGSDSSGTDVSMSLRAASEAGGNTQIESGFVATSLRGPNYERNRVNREKKKLNRDKRLDGGELIRLRIEREREQLEISRAFRRKQEEQAEISRLHRVKQERVNNDVVKLVAGSGSVESVVSPVDAVEASRRKFMEMEVLELRLKREKEQLVISQLYRKKQERMEAIASEVCVRRRESAVARSEIDIMRADNMKRARAERAEKLAEIERKENWRQEAEGVPEAQSSVKTSSSSGSISAKSSVSQRASSESSVAASFRYPAPDGSQIARQKNVRRSDYTKAQQEYINEKRRFLVMYNCEPGTWDDDVPVVAAVPRPSSTVGPDGVVRYHGL